MFSADAAERSDQARNSAIIGQGQHLREEQSVFSGRCCLCKQRVELVKSFRNSMFARQSGGAFDLRYDGIKGAVSAENRSNADVYAAGLLGVP